jgi:hypothetical protein
LGSPYFLFEVFLLCSNTKNIINTQVSVLRSVRDPAIKMKAPGGYQSPPGALTFTPFDVFYDS